MTSTSTSACGGRRGARCRTLRSSRPTASSRSSPTASPPASAPPSPSSPSSSPRDRTGWTTCCESARSFPTRKPPPTSPSTSRSPHGPRPFQRKPPPQPGPTRTRRPLPSPLEGRSLTARRRRSTGWSRSCRAALRCWYGARSCSGPGWCRPCANLASLASSKSTSNSPCTSSPDCRSSFWSSCTAAASLLRTNGSATSLTLSPTSDAGPEPPSLAGVPCRTCAVCDQLALVCVAVRIVRRQLLAKDAKRKKKEVTPIRASVFVSIAPDGGASEREKI
mmetsp:Transcript_10364/g.24537  ORF Transcript_10364/g.24537 Transcript_10364/m.24537 type:complete len:278 (+) Transcript_10364:1040-1873(+)